MLCRVEADFEGLELVSIRAMSADFGGDFPAPPPPPPDFDRPLILCVCHKFESGPWLAELLPYLGDTAPR